MPKFALKMLLTSVTVGRSSSRHDRGIQAAIALLTLLLLATVCLHIWAHGGY